MTTTAWDILLISCGVAAILTLLTVIGETMRARLPDGRTSLAVETYMTRVGSWWAMVILLAAALLIGFTGVLLLFAFASFAALREFLTYTRKRRADHMSLALAFFGVLPLQYVFVGLGAEGLFGTFIPVYAFLLLPLVSALRGDADAYLVRVAETQWALMISVFCLSHVPALMTVEINGFAGREALLIVFFILVVQAGDLFEYFFGRQFGRRRIAPGLSPKTWEGAAAGLVATAGIAAALAPITPFGTFGAMGMAVVATATGYAGSLIFAAIKRDRGLKDWSHLIPGQGGVLDQLDSAIFAAPVFFHLTATFWGA